jgi:hypothetical protein
MTLDVQGKGGFLKRGHVVAAVLASWRLVSVGESDDEEEQIYRFDAVLADVNPLWIESKPLTVLFPLQGKLREWTTEDVVISVDHQTSARLMIKGWPPRNRGVTDGTEVWRRHDDYEDPGLQRAWGLLD